MAISCILCSKRLKIDKRRPVNRQIQKYLRKNFLVEATFHDFICTTCVRPLYRTSFVSKDSKANDLKPSLVQQNTCRPGEQENQSLPVSPPSVCLKIPSATKSHAYCFICKKPGPKLIVLSASVRFYLFVDRNILVSTNSRCCPSHLDEKDYIKEECVENLKTIDHVYLNRTSILDLMEQLRKTIRSLNIQSFNFDNLSNSTDIYNLTGLEKSQFENLFTFVKEHLRSTPARSSTTTLGIFLMKMKTGLSDRVLSSIFSASRSSIKRAVHTVRKAILANFVPYNLGFQHISRDEVIANHSTKLATSLFSDQPDQVILILDGTYIYIQKSNNFYFQRRSFSLHKGRPLVKPMVIVTSSGYIVSVLGPYYADSKNNDASIVKHLIQSNMENIRDWIKPNDIFIVDRGFRDAIEFLKDLGIHTEMPAFMTRGEKQMSCEDANSSRLVTKVRWVVEAANGRIKQWKYLQHVLPTNQVPYIGDYVRIVCALINKYSSPLASNREEDEQLAEQMKRLASETNRLRDEVETKFNFRLNKDWLPASSESMEQFPKLDEGQLRTITCGTYQLKMSSSYLQEHMWFDSDVLVYEHNSSKNIFCVKLQSRHISSKTYIVWVKFSSSDIVAWYCKCRAGARVVGACSHVAAVIWYMGYARHIDSLRIGVKDWGSFLEDASQLPAPEAVDDSSDSDESNVEE